MKNKMRAIFVLVLLLAGTAAATVFARESHKEYRTLAFAECAECHKGSGIASNHGGAWDKEHRILAQRPDRTCDDCHDQSFCQDCHNGGGADAKLSRSQYKRDIKPQSHRSDWISIHPIEAKGSPTSCARCHEPSFCSDCHGRVGVTTMTIKSHARSGATQAYIAAFPTEHAFEARRTLGACQSCHPDGDVCLSCHSARVGIRVNPHPRDFKADRIQSRSNNRSCRVCHDF